MSKYLSGRQFNMNELLHLVGLCPDHSSILLFMHQNYSGVSCYCNHTKTKLKLYITAKLNKK